LYLDDHSIGVWTSVYFFFKAEDGIRDRNVTGVQTCALPILGGDHSIAIGSISGVLKHYQNPGLIWYDAHGDINTAETSPSGNIHGMPLAASLGYGHEKLTQIFENNAHIKPENVVLI